MRILAIASISFSVAVFCASFLPDLAAAEIFAIAFFLLGILFCFFRKRRFSAPVRLACFGLSFGLFWFCLYSAQTVEKAHALDGKTLPVAVVLTDYPRSTDQTASARGILATEGYPSLGVRLYDPTYTIASARPGQVVIVEARLRSADVRYGQPYEGDLASGIQLTASGKSAPVLGEVNHSLRFLPAVTRHVLLQKIDRLFSGTERIFVRSLLLGEKTEFYQQPELEVAMSRSGIMHIVAVSGMHISFLVGFLWLLFGHSRRYSLLSLLLVWFFVFVAGAPASAVRAGIMQSMLLLAPLFRRENDAITSLSFALALLLLFNPFSARSAGLQLSFCAVAGIQLFAVRMQAFFMRLLGRFSSFRVVQSIIGILARSLSVMVLSIPVTAVHFSSIQVLSPLTNILVMWAVSLCFCLSLLSVMLSLIVPSAAVFLAVPAGILAKFILAAAKAVSSIPFASLYTCSDFAVYWVLGIYLIFLLFLFLPVSLARKAIVPTSVSAVSLAVLLVLTQLHYERVSGVFSVIDVGQGECISVFSGDQTLLIDCGGIFSNENAGDIAGRYLLSCGRKQVDLLLLTHLHDDHVNGIPVLLEYLPVREIVYSAYAPDEDSQLSEILDAAERHNTKVTLIGREATATLGNLSLRLSTPLDSGDANDLCVFSLISVGEYDMLVTGDAPKAAERKFLSENHLPPVELLVAGHHGSKTSTGEELLIACPSAVAVISTGYNTYGHPSPETLESLDRHSIPVFRTDQSGTLQFTVP